MADMARVFAAEFRPRGFSVPTRRLPYRAMWLAARSARRCAWLLASSTAERMSSQKAIDELGWTRRPAAQTLRDTGQSLIDHGLVHPRR